MDLVFVSDDMPGITRKRMRGQWAYFAPDGSRITEPEEIKRLNSIALPPAYTDAWFAPTANAHILATGFDARGRKQYRYHPQFRSHREACKFDGCIAFARLLPLIRERVATDLRSRKVTRERAIASVVRLLDTGAIRVGNESYARSNGSFGATTLRMRHAKIRGATLHLSFRAKSGRQCSMRVTDRGLARFVRKMQDLPGQHLFQYIDEDGKPHPIGSSEVNGYIKEIMGDDFTAKDFRTWAASVIAFQTLYDASEDLTKHDLLDHVADRLGNTPAIARKSYIHPVLLAAMGSQARLRQQRLPRATRWISRYDRGLLEFLADQPATRELLCA